MVCDNISRNADTGYLEEIEGGFLNRDEETAVSVDVNILHEYSFGTGNLFVDAGIDISANFPKEKALLYVNSQNEDDYTDYSGQPGFPRNIYKLDNSLETGEIGCTIICNYIY